MGLAERRMIKDFQDKQLAKFEGEIHKLAGSAVPLEISWDQLMEEGSLSYCEEAWIEIFFKPTIDGLRQIGRDEMGKEAIKAGLKKIEFRNSKDTSNPDSAISFTAGTLTIDHRLANVGDTAERTKTLVRVLEKGL
jgi:hypothetical protein